MKSERGQNFWSSLFQPEKERFLRSDQGLFYSIAFSFDLYEHFWVAEGSEPAGGSGVGGLAPTPYDSGGSQREQGISKAGNRRVRAMSVEMAWAWLCFQPESRMSRWFLERFAQGGSRLRRIGIAALERRLLVSLWRYLEFGVISEGARIYPGSLKTGDY